MMYKATPAIATIALLVLGIAGCITIIPSREAPTIIPTPTSPREPAATAEPEPTGTPEYVILPFTVEGYSDYTFHIHVGSDQTLHLLWSVEEGKKVWFHIITPTNKLLGFYDNGEYADGTLTEGSCKGFMEGRTTFSPSQYGWGEGYYEMVVSSHSSNPSEVKVRYWIGDKPMNEEE